MSFERCLGTERPASPVTSIVKLQPRATTKLHRNGLGRLTLAAIGACCLRTLNLISTDPTYLTVFWRHGAFPSNVSDYLGNEMAYKILHIIAYVNN